MTGKALKNKPTNKSSTGRISMLHSNDDFPLHTKKKHPIKKQDIHPSTLLTGAKQAIFDLLGEYSLKHENLVGLDITPHYIRLCQMDSSTKKPKLKNLASACIEDNFVLDDIFTNSTIYIDNLHSLVEECGLSGKEVALSIPVSGSIMRTLRIPEISDKELQKAETLKSLWHISLAMDRDFSEYAISAQVISRGLNPTPDEDTSEKMMEILLVAVRQSILAIFTHIAKSADLKPVVAVLRCFALENALESMRKVGNNILPAKGNAFLEFGSDENYLFIPSPEGLCTYDMYLSSQERMSLAKNTKDAGILTTLAKNFTEQIQQIITSHEKQHPSDKITHLYVTSSLPVHVKNVGELPTITTFVTKLAMILNTYKVSECTFCERAGISEQLTDKVNAEGTLSSWVVTMGLAKSRLDAFGYLKKTAKISNMNILPEAARFRRFRKTKIISRAFGIAALLETCVLALAIYIGLYSQDSLLERTMAPFAPVAEKYEAQMQQFEKLQAVTDKLDTLEAIRNELPSNQLLLLSAYKYLGQTIPDGVWLKQITFEAPGTIEIIGNSVDDQNILEFIRLLNKSREFSKVSLKTMQAVKEFALGSNQPMDVKKFKLGGEFINEHNE